MNIDIRIAVSFKDHRKRKKLKALLGPGSTDYLIDLWISTAMNHPSGVLTGMDDLDVAIEAGWDGEPEIFISALMKCGFLEQNEDGTYFLHDWGIHQKYAIHAENRSKIASNASNTRWGKVRNAASNKEQCSEHKTALLNDTTSNPPSP